MLNNIEWGIGGKDEKLDTYFDDNIEILRKTTRILRLSLKWVGSP